MDRKKEELEESIKQITPTAATNILTTTDDDTSTESSDTFETWTLVNDKENKKHKDKLEDSGNRVEVLKNTDREKKEEEDEIEKEQKIKEQETQLQDSPIDDFSDGISIISESESVGRISPHPYLRDHLQDLNLKFSLTEHMDDIVLNQLREDRENETTPLVIQQNQEAVVKQELRQRSRSSATADGEIQALQKASQTVSISGGFRPLVKRSLEGIFYVGVGLAILALIGKIIHPTWQPLASVGSSSSAELEQKVNDMELQNNLMRAEIDLLNKQVKYLSSLNDPQQKQGKYKEFKESKTFKAWLGNGDTLKPVDITKQDLKKPYKCPDGSFVEIANMCVEQKGPEEPSIVDQFGQVVEDLKQQSEAFKTFEKVAEELQGFQDNPFEQLQEAFSEQVATPSNAKNKPIYQTPEDYQKQNLPYTEKYQKPPTKGEDSLTSTTHKHSKYDKNERKYENNSKFYKEYKKSFGKEDNNNKQSKEFQKYPNQDNFQSSSKEWKSDKFKYDNNSKEKKYRKEKDFNSNENSKENQSKERFNKQKRKYDKNNDHDDRDDDSGEWQEKYMKHREQLRKQNEQKYQDNKNWYIKRGDSRENKRSGEKRYR